MLRQRSGNGNKLYSKWGKNKNLGDDEDSIKMNKIHSNKKPQFRGPLLSYQSTLSTIFLLKISFLSLSINETNLSVHPVTLAFQLFFYIEVTLFIKLFYLFA